MAHTSRLSHQGRKAIVPESRWGTWLPAACLAAAVASSAAAGQGPRRAAADPGRDEPRRVASRAATVTVPQSAKPPSVDEGRALADPVAMAKQAIADCKGKYARVRDYTCTFVKRERIDGRLSPRHVMHMKARTNPSSIYLRFQTPNKGREAIYNAGRNSGRVQAHDVGIGKFLAGTMNLDPRGALAMEDCRHPITEAGIGVLIDTIARRWNDELTPEESRVTFQTNLRIGAHPCTMIEAIHPGRHPRFLFHKVRLYIDHEHGLPIRLEGYDWPEHPGAAPELVEEYTYLDVRINVGLSDHDFDANNRAYSFGRF